jgi:hypothetical protein
MAPVSTRGISFDPVRVEASVSTRADAAADATASATGSTDGSEVSGPGFVVESLTRFSLSPGTDGPACRRPGGMPLREASTAG